MKTARHLGLTILIALLVLCSWLAPLDAPAKTEVDAGLKKALITFATARALNGVLSVIQSTQFSAQPLGVGVTLTPGQMLAPVDELVKHFSNLMLAASVAFGVQKVLISISGYWVISLVLTGVAFVWVSYGFSKHQAPLLLSKTLIMLLLLRFAVPIGVLGSELLSQEFLAAEYASSQRAIETSSGEALLLNPAAPLNADNASLLGKMKGWISKHADVKTRFQEMTQTTEKAIEHMVKLMVIFLLQTLVMPLLLIWGLFGLAKSIFPLQRTALASNSK